MERESKGTKYMAANCEGRQSPLGAVELRKNKRRIDFSCFLSSVTSGKLLKWYVSNVFMVVTNNTGSDWIIGFISHSLYNHS
jgi:hypothetical protein